MEKRLGRRRKYSGANFEMLFKRITVVWTP